MLLRMNAIFLAASHLILDKVEGEAPNLPLNPKLIYLQKIQNSPLWSLNMVNMTRERLH